LRWQCHSDLRFPRRPIVTCAAVTSTGCGAAHPNRLRRVSAVQRARIVAARSAMSAGVGSAARAKLSAGA
jgi:hypothetical protein